MWLGTISIKMHCMFPNNPQFKESHMITGDTKLQTSYRHKSMEGIFNLIPQLWLYLVNINYIKVTYFDQTTFDWVVLS